MTKSFKENGSCEACLTHFIRSHSERARMQTRSHTHTQTHTLASVIRAMHSTIQKYPLCGCFSVAAIPRERHHALMRANAAKDNRDMVFVAFFYFDCCSGWPLIELSCILDSSCCRRCCCAFLFTSRLHLKCVNRAKQTTDGPDNIYSNDGAKKCTIPPLWCHMLTIRKCVCTREDRRLFARIWGGEGLIFPVGLTFMSKCLCSNVQHRECPPRACPKSILARSHLGHLSTSVWRFGQIAGARPVKNTSQQP